MARFEVGMAGEEADVGMVSCFRRVWARSGVCVREAVASRGGDGRDLRVARM